MKKYFTLLLLLFSTLALTTSTAQNEKKSKKEKKEQPVKLRALIKTAKQALKANNNQQNAEQQLLANLPREDFDQKDRARIYYYCALLQQSLHAEPNRKAYLKQQYDTTVFFSGTLAIYQHLIRCDSVDTIANARGQVRRKYESDVNSLMKKHRKNLLSGGIFEMRKKNYALAYDFMDAYIRSNKAPADTIIPRVSYWATICGYNIKNAAKTRKYIDAAIQFADSAQHPILQEYKARTYMWDADEANWVKQLNEGVKRYPQHDYFFLNLLDWHNSHRQYNQGLALADSLLDMHREKALFWYAKSLLSLGKEDYKLCIQYSDSCIQRDANYADAYYNKGLSYCNLALIAQQDVCNDLNNPQCVEDRKAIQQLYRSALPALEQLRKLQPDNAQRWAPVLYRVYLNLNMGKEFDEIDGVLKNLK